MGNKQGRKKAWKKKKKHIDSVHIKNAGKITFSRGRNGFGARMDGKIQVLKKKW